MRIGVLGSGLMGGKLGRLFARAGHEVLFSYSHDDKKLERLAREAGNGARAGSPAEAAEGADAVMLAVHWSRLGDVLRKAGALSGKVVVSCSLPMSRDDSKLVIAHSSSGAEELAKRIPGASVVAAFNTVPSEVLFSVFESRGRKVRPSLAYCGNGAKSKRVAARLIRDIGFEPVDAGPLRVARYLEPFGLLVAEIAYSGKGNSMLAYRFQHYSRSTPGRSGTQM
jgi:8-hydroxy-5-deazaflavin:NADPH oxidoreductase